MKPKRLVLLTGMVVALLIAICSPARAQAPMKRESTLYPPALVEQVRKNATDAEWVAKVRDELVEAAGFWREQRDDALWALMFGPAITRSWMVWSNGYCPACGKSVPMYNWEMDALKQPWKTRCPLCKALFPTNDFYAFYQSGLDDHAVFDPARANRSLLFNAEHPDPNDPLHLFGVDDGEGYVEGDKRWRFIGAYLIYGQWKQAVVNGIRILSAAYLFTGDPVYAHKAGVLLDRVADLYPEFDFGKQALVYERQGDRGYVSTWHDACEETRELAMAYDMIFEALWEDADLPSFLSQKAKQYGIPNAKASFADIQRNIEGRILADAIAHRPKITTNYPRTEIAVALMLAVLGWPENQDAFYEVVDPMLDRATAVDGITGEKGLAGYSSFTIQALASFIAELSKVSPDFLKEIIKRHPRLKETYRFHIDTLCLDRYYPQSGDSGAFAIESPSYQGMSFLRPGTSIKGFPYWTYLPPSCYTLLWRLYECTGDAAFVQIAYRANENSFDGLPHDFYCSDPSVIHQGFEEVIRREGATLRLGSVDKEQWHLALLRSGEGKDARVAWLDYDAGGGHGHADGMNLGLFAKGLDLMPEFGYPPVQFGGWESPRARWYTMTAAHNTVVVDGRNTPAGAGETTLWADGSRFRVIRAAGQALNNGNRYERTVALVDISPQDCYVIDLFRVAGGRNHTKFMQSHFGKVTTTGLSLAPAADYGHETQMRNFRMDAEAQPGWCADWVIEDRLHYLPDDATVGVRYTDLTNGAQAGLSEAWIVAGGYNSAEELWIPRLVIQRESRDETALESAFLSVIEPYEHTPALTSIRRMVLQTPEGEPLGDSHVALTLQHANGRRDLFLARDPEASTVSEVVIVEEPGIRTDADVCLLRLSADQRLEYGAVCHASHVFCGGRELFAGPSQAFRELP